MLLRIANGTVYDPANGIDGRVRDIWVRDGKVAAPPNDSPETPDRTIDAAGLVVMPGGVDLHTHVAGPKVNAARKLRPDDRRSVAPIHKSQHGRSGTTGSLPSTFATGALYAGLGYTTAIDAAIPPLGARHAHLELADTPTVDAGILLTLGDHHFALEQIAANESERLKDFIAWILQAAHAFGVKLVNPGGSEAYKRGGEFAGFDEPIEPFGVSQRRILSAFATAVDDLRLPHPVHVHCTNLGRPGNWTTTLESMKSLAGRRGHFTHIQFHSYGGDPNDPASFCSESSALAQFVNEHPEITVDVGQVLFGDTTALTGDSAVGHYLQRSTGRRWTDFDTECEAGCGIIPIEYRANSLIHALQWAIGLEWLLLVDDPWRIALTTDHPNGATFVRYPEVVHLLMKRDKRREMLDRLPAKLRERSQLADLDREYTLNEIAIITRAGPARILGLKDKGHLGVGADADITMYIPSNDVTAMFSMPKYVLKAGQTIVENCEPRQTVFGPVLTVAPDHDSAMLHSLRRWFNDRYSISFSNYPIGSELCDRGRRVVQCL